MFDNFEMASEKEKKLIVDHIKSYLFDLYKMEGETFAELRANRKSKRLQHKYNDYVQQIGGAHFVLECLGVDVSKLTDEYYNISRNGST